MVAPSSTRLEVARAYAISKLSWIRRQQSSLLAQEREPARQFVGRESHYLWGRRYLLSVLERDQKPSVELDHRALRLSVRPGTSPDKRAEIMHEWHRSLLHAAVPPLIQKWEQVLGVSVSSYFLQRMKTKWGSCTPASRRVWLNSELAKKPVECIEYIVVHELLHLAEPNHGERFVALMNRHLPRWAATQKRLNAAPLGHEDWDA